MYTCATNSSTLYAPLGNIHILQPNCIYKSQPLDQGPLQPSVKSHTLVYFLTYETLTNHPTLPTFLISAWCHTLHLAGQVELWSPPWPEMLRWKLSLWNGKEPSLTEIEGYMWISIHSYIHVFLSSSICIHIISYHIILYHTIVNCSCNVVQYNASKFEK